MEYRSKVRTCLWFEKGGLEAAEFYVSLLPWSAIGAIHPHGNDADPMVVEFTLHGTPMMILTAEPDYTPSPAASISVLSQDQQETDRLWSALVADGGAESRCGWLTDRWDMSWQIVPEVLPAWLNASDRAAAGRAQAAMLGMAKIDIAAIEAAFRGEGEG
jgi:predicted 3-demethylubiquinone-9 3-methyltransferase (glyoxalase superfamily)